MRRLTTTALGGVLGLAWATGAAAQSGPAGLAVVGTVYDSVGRAPLGGAVVQLVSRTDASLMLTSTADSLGRFRLTGARPGQYIAGVLHPTLDLLGLDASMRVVELTRDTLQHLDLTIANDARTRARVCGEAVSDSVGVLVGQVRDADSDAPLNDARVVLTWQELVIGGSGGRIERRRVPAPVRPGGYFAICGVPADDDVLATAEAEGRRSGELRIRATAGRMTRRDFTLGTATSATAAASGVVRHPDGRPVGGAIVLVPGTETRTTTAEDGRYTLAGLPSGTFPVEARAIGFQPASVPVALSARRVASADVVLGPRVTNLETVHVLGRGSRTLRAQQGFVERMQHGGSGKFVTAQQIERMGATTSSDALQGIPGIVVAYRGTPPATTDGPQRQVWMQAPMGRGYCKPDVYIDGFRIEGGAIDLDVLVTPQNVLGFEVYRSAASAPAQFTPTTATFCGVILVWSKP